MKKSSFFKKIGKAFLAAGLAAGILFTQVTPAFAEGGWPEFEKELTAASAIVIDADTGTILYGKDMHSKRYPASITKLVTALVVLDNCSLEETVTFTGDAVNGLESGATTAGISAGDTLSVEESLYALLLKSANEVANGLAIHVSGSIEDFAKKMTETAAGIGCLNSDFRTPSGLTNSEHVTTAYDMALIAKELIKNEDFLEIESHSSHTLPGTTKYPDGLTIHMGHQMLQKGSEYFDERVFAGKTGFTSASGNTLVTCASDGDRRVIAVVLKDRTPDHYKDTKALIDFGLSSFRKVSPDAGELIETLKMKEKLTEDGELDADGPEELKFAKELSLLLPVEYDLSLLKAEYDYSGSGAQASSGTEDALQNDGRILAEVKFTYADRVVGTGTLIDVHDPSLDIENVSVAENVEKVESEEGGSGKKAVLIAVIAVLLILAAAAAALVLIRRKKERERRERLRRRRRERLRELHVSEEEFGSVMKNIRSGKNKEQ